jgi:hypothetical protein
MRFLFNNKRCKCVSSAGLFRACCLTQYTSTHTTFLSTLISRISCLSTKTYKFCVCYQEPPPSIESQELNELRKGTTSVSRNIGPYHRCTNCSDLMERSLSCEVAFASILWSTHRLPPSTPFDDCIYMGNHTCIRF